MIIRQHQVHSFSNNTSQPEWLIYTDGAFFPKTRQLGWAFLVHSINDADTILHQESGHHSLCFKQKSQNFAAGSLEMELTAAVRALEWLQRQPYRPVTQIRTDALILIEGLFYKFPNWQNNDWRTPKGQPIKHRLLWQKLHTLTDCLQVQWIWVKGHSKDISNQKVDQMARKTSPLKQVQFPT